MKLTPPYFCSYIVLLSSLPLSLILSTSPPLPSSPLLSSPSLPPSLPPSQPSDSGDPETAQAVSDHYLVELSALTASGQDTIGTEMKAFADHLKPYPHHSSELLYPSNWNNANTHSLPSYTVAWNVQFSNLASLFQDKGVV